MMGFFCFTQRRKVPNIWEAKSQKITVVLSETDFTIDSF